MITSAIPDAESLPEKRECSPEAGRLVDRAKKGEQAAFLALFQSHAPRIYTLSLRLAGNVSSAERLARDIFLEAFRNLDAVSNDEAFAILIYRCAAKRIAMRSNADASKVSGELAGQDKLCEVGLASKECRRAPASRKKYERKSGGVEESVLNLTFLAH